MMVLLRFNGKASVAPSDSPPPVMFVDHFSRRLGVVLLLVLLPSLSANAQTKTDTTASDPPPAFQKGGWGLQYEATSLDGALSGFQGSLFSGRYHFSERQALRVGISVNASTRDEEEVDELHRDPLAVDRVEQRSEQDFHDYALSVEYVHYVRPTNRLFVYAGVGPRVGYNKSRQEQTIPDQGGSRRETDVLERTTYRVGASGALGVEWFVHPHISLSVEYPFAVEYSDRDEESTSRLLEDGSVVREQTSTTEIDRYEIGGETVRIGVTFSFGP